MAQHVRRDLLGDAGFDRILLHDALDGTLRQAHLAVIARTRARLHEQRLVHVLARRKVRPDGRLRLVRQEDDAHLLALAADREFVFGQIKIAVERAELGKTETGREEQLHDGFVAEAQQRRRIRRIKESRKLRIGNEIKMPLADFGQVDAVGGERFDIALHEIFEKDAERDQMVVLGIFLKRRRGLAADLHAGRAIEPEAELAHGIVGDIGRALDTRIFEEAREVAVVILDRLQAPALFDFHMLEELALEREDVCHMEHSVAQLNRADNEKAALW